jgi:hypothetical protein
MKQLKSGGRTNNKCNFKHFIFLVLNKMAEDLKVESESFSKSLQENFNHTIDEVLTKDRVLKRLNELRKSLDQ